MTCAGCAGRVERALTAVEGVIGADINLATDRARVTIQGQDIPEALLLRAVQDAGFTAKTIEDPLSEPDDSAVFAHKRLRWRFLISASLSLPFQCEE